jgi:ABC-type bacteriocin/lantibiotic exporter with double-glycine peptidase domain
MLIYITFREKKDRMTSLVAILLISIVINFIYLSNSKEPKLTARKINENILQSDPMSCAPAALANISKFHNKPFSEKVIANAMGTTIQGTNTAQIVLGAKKLKLKAEIFHNLKSTELTTSSILFVDAPLGKEKHAVAFLRKQEQEFLIVDPDKGAFLWTDEYLNSRWHGNGVFIQP